MRNLAIVLILALASAHSALAWGDTGHQIIASIASSLLQANCSDCATDVTNILDDTMEDVATWADQVREQASWKWTAPLHYVDTPDWACTFNSDQDCADDMCVVGALNNFTQQINTGLSAGSIDWQLDSLKFVIHFVGDCHQPLHVAFASDRGGNDITGTFEGDDYNLHAVWDNAIIEKRMSDDFNGDQDQYTAWLLGEVQGDWAAQAAKWAQCANGDVICAEDWASETAALACSHAYKDQDGNVIQDGFDLGDDYYNFNSGIVDQQLAKAGVRLAASLQRVFQSSKLPKNTIA